MMMKQEETTEVVSYSSGNFTFFFMLLASGQTNMPQNGPSDVLRYPTLQVLIVNILLDKYRFPRKL